MPIKIALLGESMTDCWGECAELSSELKRLFKRSEFSIINHGLNDTRLGYGLHRISNHYLKRGQNTPPLSLSNPDIVIIESFAYNQHSDGPEGLTEYRDTLRRVFDEIEATTDAKILFYLTIPPHRDRFGENVPNFQNTSRVLRQGMADDIKLYLDEARRIAHDEGWQLADVCAEVEKRVEAGQNLRRFINQSNNVYPSQLGFEVTAGVLVQSLDDFRMIDESRSTE